MMHINRVMRRPLAVATAGAAAALLAIGGSVAAMAAPKAHHRSGRTRHAATHRSRHDDWSSGGFSAGTAPWGSVSGQQVNLYTLKNRAGMVVKITNYGGVVQSIWVPDAKGNLTNVALGFSKLSDYVADFTQGATQTQFPAAGGSGDTFFGAIIGRYANRIGGASFDLNNTTYKLDANNGTNTLHGGYLGWNTAVWTGSTWSNRHSAGVALTTTFPAGEGCLATLSPGCTGFPAAVKATVTYQLTARNQLKIGYTAVNQSSSDSTVINLTNHTYFNLAGEGSNHTVYHQLLALNSDAYTPVNTNLIPESPYFVPVSGTAFDFRTLHPIGQNIRAAGLPDGTTGPLTQLQIAHGFDHNWVLNGQGSYRLAAVAQDPQNGILLKTYTTEPGVQVYTGNFLVGDLIGTSGNTYRQGDAFTLETQHYPDSPHHIGDPAWPSVVLDPGKTFSSKTAFAFSVNRYNLEGRVRFP